MQQMTKPAGVFAARPQRTMGRKEQVSGKRKPSALERRLARLPLPPVIGLMFAGVGATLMLATPLWLLEQSVDQLGLSALIPAAAPPLGMTARLLLSGMGALALGTLAFVTSWAICKITARAMPAKTKAAPRQAEAPVADVGRRTPIVAGQELGSPLMSEEALDLGTAIANGVAEPLDDDDDGALDLAAFASPVETEAQPADAPYALEERIEQDEQEARVQVAEDVPEPGFTPYTPLTEQEAEAIMQPLGERSVSTLLSQLESGLSRLEAAGRTVTRPARSAHEEMRLAANG